MKKLVIALLIVMVLGFSIMGKFVWELTRATKTNTEVITEVIELVDMATNLNYKLIKAVELRQSVKIETLKLQIESLEKQVIVNTEDIRVTRISLGNIATYVILLDNAAAIKFQQVEKKLRAEIAEVDKKALASIKLIRNHAGKKVLIFWSHDKGVKEDAEKILLIDEFLKKLEEIKSQENN